MKTTWFITLSLLAVFVSCHKNRSRTSFAVPVPAQGTILASATPPSEIRVLAPAPVESALWNPDPVPPVFEPRVSLEQRLREATGFLQDALFDYDQFRIRPDAQAALQRDAAVLLEVFDGFPDFVVTVEGHCDERGSAEYNLALGDLRAQRAREFLQQLGVPAARLRAISYGKDRPHCTEPVEACWQENRRAHLSTAR